METMDITVEILKGIRDEIRQTNIRVDALRQETANEFKAVRGDLSDLRRHAVESEVRTGTAITDMVSTMRNLMDLLRSQLDLRPRVEKCEQEIVLLKQRLPDA